MRLNVKRDRGLTRHYRKALRALGYRNFPKEGDFYVVGSDHEVVAPTELRKGRRYYFKFGTLVKELAWEQDKSGDRLSKCGRFAIMKQPSGRNFSLYYFTDRDGELDAHPQFTGTLAECKSHAWLIASAQEDVLLPQGFSV